MGKIKSHGRWLVSDELWSKLEPLLPPPPRRSPTRGGATARARPQRDERHFVRVAHGLPVERAECDRHLQQFHGALAVSAMDPSRWVCQTLGTRIDGVRRTQGH